MIDGADDPTLTTIGVHVAGTTRMWAGALSCQRATVQLGGRTEVTLFLDVAGIDRLALVLAEARELLTAPPQMVAA